LTGPRAILEMYDHLALLLALLRLEGKEFHVSCGKAEREEREQGQNGERRMTALVK